MQFEATGNQMKPYLKGLMAQCVRVLPSPHPPSISTEALSVILGVAIAIISLSSLVPLCIIYQRRWKLHKALNAEVRLFISDKNIIQ